MRIRQQGKKFPRFFSDPQGPSYPTGSRDKGWSENAKIFVPSSKKVSLIQWLKSLATKELDCKTNARTTPTKKWNLFKVSPRFFHMFSARHCHLCFFYIWVQKGGEKRWPVFEVPGFARCSKRLHSWKAVGNAKPTNPKGRKNVGRFETPGTKRGMPTLGDLPRNRRPVLRESPRWPSLNPAGY